MTVSNHELPNVITMPVNPELKKTLLEAMDLIDASDVEIVFNEALTAYIWMLRESFAQKTIASYNEEQKERSIVKSPGLRAAQEKGAQRRKRRTDLEIV